MKGWSSCVEKRMENLKKVIAEKKKVLESAPKGVVNIAATKSRVQYYMKKDVSSKERKYINKKNQRLAIELCQKDYDEKVILAAERELKQLSEFMSSYNQYTYEDVFDSLNVHRRKLVMPIEIPVKEFVEEWEKEEFVKKSFWEDSPEFYTEKGERVRSKTELLIANALIRYGVPYRYECPLYLEGYGKIHPDFTVLNVRTREEYYWEHLGMMDNPEYVADALHRIAMYEKNGFFLGERLIVTYETAKFPINSKEIDRKILRTFV